MEWLEASWRLLLAYPYAAVFVGSLVDATAIPFPGRLLLVVSGSLAAAGMADPLGLITAAAAGAVCGDHIWFVLGRWRGQRLLALACRGIAGDLDHCLAATKWWFTRFGPLAIVLGRFAAAVRVAAGPLVAGRAIAYPHYLFYETLAAVVWASLWIFLGLVLGDGWIAWDERGAYIALALVGATVASLALIVARCLSRRRGRRFERSGMTEFRRR